MSTAEPGNRPVTFRAMFSEELRARREQINLLQREFAEKAHVSLSSVKQYEAGKKKPERKFVTGCDEFYGCPGTFERLYDGMIAESYPSWFGPRVLFEDKATRIHEWEMRGCPFTGSVIWAIWCWLRGAAVARGLGSARYLALAARQLPAVRSGVRGPLPVAVPSPFPVAGSPGCRRTGAGRAPRGPGPQGMRAGLRAPRLRRPRRALVRGNGPGKLDRGQRAGQSPRPPRPPRCRPPTPGASRLPAAVPTARRHWRG